MKLLSMDNYLSKTPTSKLRMKICKACPKPFQPWRSTQVCCSAGCALALVGIKKAKQAARDLASGRIELMSLREHLNKAQTVFNAWIRERDRLEPCISCQRHHTGQYHAGHLYTTKARPQSRFDPDNCHKQCSVCNNYLSGNIILYKENLIKKIGQAAFDKLADNNSSADFTIEIANAIAKDYKARLKALKAINAASDIMTD